MEQLNFITNILGINDKNIIILVYLDAGTHKEVIAKLDYPPSKCHNFKDKWLNMPFKKNPKSPTSNVLATRLSFDWENAVSTVKTVGKIAVAETSLVKKNHQIATIVKQKITQKLIEEVPMTAISESLSVSTSTVIR